MSICRFWTFSRPTTTVKTQASGWGLGLSWVRSVVRVMAGRLCLITPPKTALSAIHREETRKTNRLKAAQHSPDSVVASIDGDRFFRSFGETNRWMIVLYPGGCLTSIATLLANFNSLTKNIYSRISTPGLVALLPHRIFKYNSHTAPRT
jgi:hypothetical protein